MIDPLELRRALGCFVTGVTVVTTVDGEGRKRGFTANSFTSVSLDPPLVLVCIAKKAVSFAAFAEARHFAVNILAEEQKLISSTFASKIPDKFEAAPSHVAASGAPILDGVIAWLDCETYQKVEAGDHLILVGRVLDVGQSDRTPLGFFGGNYVSFSLEREAAEATHDHQTSVGGVFERDGSVLFMRKGDQLWLPTGQTLGERAAEPGSLFERLQQDGVTASVSFVFSIGHEDGSSKISVYYRGEVREGPPSGSRTAVMIPFEKIPWNQVHSRNQTAMLQRYIKERAEARFGIYVGNVGGGTIKSLERNV